MTICTRFIEQKIEEIGLWKDMLFDVLWSNNLTYILPAALVTYHTSLKPETIYNVLRTLNDIKLWQEHPTMLTYESLLKYAVSEFPTTLFSQQVFQQLGQYNMDVRQVIMHCFQVDNVHAFIPLIKFAEQKNIARLDNANQMTKLSVLASRYRQSYHILLWLLQNAAVNIERALPHYHFFNVGHNFNSYALDPAQEGVVLYLLTSDKFGVQRFPAAYFPQLFQLRQPEIINIATRHLRTCLKNKTTSAEFLTQFFAYFTDASNTLDDIDDLPTDIPLHNLLLLLSRHGYGGKQYVLRMYIQRVLEQYDIPARCADAKQYLDTVYSLFRYLKLQPYVDIVCTFLVQLEQACSVNRNASSSRILLKKTQH